MHKLACRIAVFFALFLGARAAGAWGEHEHIKLGARALRAMDQAALTALREGWAAARQGDAALSKALCEELSVDYGACLGLPALPMLAADHACSPGHLDRMISEPWVLDVIREVQTADTDTQKLATQRADAASMSDMRLEIRRKLDVDLQAADPRYLQRASSNISHFTRPREEGADTARAFLSAAVRPGQRINATALYAAFHASSLRYAIAASGAQTEERRSFLWWAYLLQAFALHYLEDSFSAGHFVASREDDADRLGTHDYFCQHGIEARTWKGEWYDAFGDAYLSPADEEHASRAVAESLRQFAAALAPGGEARGAALTPAERAAASRLPSYAATNTCSLTTVPETFGVLAGFEPLLRVIEHTPIPSKDPPGSATFRSEYGPFIPLIVSGQSGVALYARSWSAPEGAYSPMRSDVRIGVGIGMASDDAISEYQDGLMFIAPTATLGSEDMRFPYIGIGGHLRAPYTYVPGDIVFFAPLAALGSSWAYKNIGKALKGDRSLLGFNNVFYTSSRLRIQADLGREISLLVYIQQGLDVRPGAVKPGVSVTRVWRASRWDLTVPVLTFRVGHSFGNMHANDVLVRLAAQLGNTMAGAERVITQASTRHVDYGFYFGPSIILTNAARFYF